ncbi:MAG TPA: T9SS type A sorting domain-containing protein, partial [Flavipsychrobacter sp.]|nr:T9SS type A sorting domain-containing protein [Flavipsychrobacter sp.]
IDFDPNAGINNVTANGTFPDNFVLRLDAGGNFLSQCHIGNGDWTYGRDLALDGSDNIYLAGAFADMLDLDPGVGTYTVGTFPSYNAYVLKLSSSLNARNVFSVGVPAFIYPNPATDELTIKTEEQYQSYTISNSLGQQIIKADLRAKETKVDIRSLPPGLYYLNIIGENETNVRKFVKI